MSTEQAPVVTAQETVVPEPVAVVQAPAKRAGRPKSAAPKQPAAPKAKVAKVVKPKVDAEKVPH